MVSVKQFVNTNLLGGDVERKEYADMDDVSEVDNSDDDIQEENTLDVSNRQKKQKMSI